MKTVRMKYAISGGRADGSEWPPAGGELSCDSAEADELVAAGIAEHVTSGAAGGESSPSAPAAPEPRPRAAAARKKPAAG